MRLALLSNVTVSFLAAELEDHFSLFIPDGYNQWVRECIAPSTDLVAFAPEAIAVLLDGSALIEGSDADAELTLALDQVAMLAQNLPTSAVYVSTLDFKPVSVAPADAAPSGVALSARWCEGLAERMAAHPNLHLFDLASVIAEHGRKLIYDDKMWYLGSAPYSLKGTRLVARALTDRVVRTQAKRKKVLVVDLDNTLWGGVLGEDGADGIVLSRSLTGAVYRDAQLRLKEIAATGVLLAIASKNDEDLVRAVLRDHPQMALREDDFVAIMANWEPKSRNIAELATRLNLGLDSFVFLDDNPVERESVRLELPDVTVAEFPADVTQLPKVVSALFDDHFFTQRLTQEDAAKTAQYQAEEKRQVAKAASASIDDYIRSLGITITVGEARDANAARVAQLTGKTNQFNLLTRTFSDEELAAYRAKPGSAVYVAEVTDRYGDYGLVFVLMLTVAGRTATIDNLLMSCRVMGRHIEDAVLAAVEERLAAQGVSDIVGAYVPTARNSPVSGLLDRLGFDRVGDAAADGRIDYRRTIGAQAPERRLLNDVVWVAS